MARPNRSKTDLHELIRDLDARCRQAQAAGSSTAATPPDHWEAVLFRVREQLFLTPLEQIAEVLDLPWEITRVPGTRPWLLGVANNRGTLLPIYDLATLIDGSQIPRHHPRHETGVERRREVRRRERVLVVRQGELPCGLAVSDAIGMRHVRLDDRSDALPEGLGPARAYVESSFLLDGVAVPVIRLRQMIADPLFNAAMT